ILCLRGQDVLSGVQERIRVSGKTEARAVEVRERVGIAEQRNNYEQVPRFARDDNSNSDDDLHCPSSTASFRVEDIPLDDEEAFRAMRSGELIGIPQSASPAMRQAHIRLRTADLHDACLVRAGIRPG